MRCTARQFPYSANGLPNSLLLIKPSRPSLVVAEKSQYGGSSKPKGRADLALRKIENIDKSKLDGGCLLCSEDKPHRCHRRLVAEYLKKKWSDVKIENL